jgi:inosine/xanthosine triphosphatase
MPETVIVGSTNPVKLDATRRAFHLMLPQLDITVEGLSVPSGVSDQPMSRTETRQGAQNRAQAVLQQTPGTAYAVGIEGGVEVVDAHLEVFAWVVVVSADGQTGRAQTGVFYLPQEVTRLIVDEGMELGHADDVVFGRTNSKQANGSIGILTDDVLTRADYYVNAVVMALIPFKKPHLTWSD